MTARLYYEKNAGPWVAYIHRPDSQGRLSRWYRWSTTNNWSFTSSPGDAVRYDTKAEALASIAGPRRRGWKRIAHRVED